MFSLHVPKFNYQGTSVLSGENYSPGHYLYVNATIVRKQHNTWVLSINSPIGGIQMTEQSVKVTGTRLTVLALVQVSPVSVMKQLRVIVKAKCSENIYT